MKDKFENKGADPEDDPKKDGDNPELDKDKNQWQKPPFPGTGNTGPIQK